MIEVKVIEVPGAVRNVALEDGATVADALSTAGMTRRDGFNLVVDGTAANSDTTLSDGARIVMSKGAKGNA